MIKSFPKIAVALGLSTVLFAGASAQAVAFTPVTPSSFGGPTHNDIFTAVYDGTFTPTTGTTFGGPSFTSGSITAERLPDDQDNDLDQLFPSGQYISSARARFANFGQDFGYSTTALPSVFLPLFSVTGQGYNPPQTSSGSLVTAQSIYFARSGSQGSQVFSDPDLNGGFDGLVTYELSGDVDPSLGANETAYVLFFNDTNTDAIDGDYNDLVVEVRTSPIPEPATAGLALTLLGGGLLFTRPRHRRGEV